MTDVVVELARDLARTVRENGSSEELNAVLAAAAAMGIALAPEHPGIDDEDLSRFLSGEASDMDAADAAARRLAELPGVQAAYPKSAPSVP